MDSGGCPVTDYTARYVDAAHSASRRERYDASFFTTPCGDADLETIAHIVESHGSRPHTDVLMHGDYRLPNIILDHWSFSGFVDLDHAGLADRHIAVFWALWTLRFNLHTDEYRDRFIDVYGRDLIDEDMLRVVAAVEVFG